MSFFVNLPLSYAFSQPELLEKFFQRALCPELGIDTDTIQAIPLAWHRETASRFQDAGLSCAVHLPFFDLSPGSLNTAIWLASQETLMRAVEIAHLYAPHHFVGHPSFDVTQHAHRQDEWLERSSLTWHMVMRAAPNIPLFLENVYEQSPLPLTLLVDRLAEICLHGRAGICFDLGHWHAFAGGSHKKDFSFWLQSFGNRINHIHLHDNDGTHDQHVGVGQGKIPFEAIFSALQQADIFPSITLEPHEEQALEDTFAFFAAHPHWQYLLGESDVNR